MWENHKHDVQTQVVSAFGGVSATAARSVATYAPMKRGLKDREHWIDLWQLPVATYAPMKRGLKEINVLGARRWVK